MGVYRDKTDLIQNIVVRDKTNYDSCLHYVWIPDSGNSTLNSIDHEIVSNLEIENAYNVLSSVSNYNQERVDNHSLNEIRKDDTGKITAYAFSRQSDRPTLGHKKDQVWLEKDEEDNWEMKTFLA